MERLISYSSPSSQPIEGNQHQSLKSEAQSAYLNLMRTCSTLLGPMEHLLKRHGISPAKYHILRVLRGSLTNGECKERGLPSLEIADRLITRVPDITRLVDGLEAEAMVTRTRSTEDRRVVYVGITAKGMELLGILEEPMMDLHHQSLAHMNTAELAELNRLLVKMRVQSSKEET
jgi:DNA-binding MarR family transcriptional regulator